RASLVDGRVGAHQVGGQDLHRHHVLLVIHEAAVIKRAIAGGEQAPAQRRIDGPAGTAGDRAEAKRVEGQHLAGDQTKLGLLRAGAFTTVCKRARGSETERLAAAKKAASSEYSTWWSPSMSAAPRRPEITSWVKTPPW